MMDESKKRKIWPSPERLALAVHDWLLKRYPDDYFSTYESADLRYQRDRLRVAEAYIAVLRDIGVCPAAPPEPGQLVLVDPVAKEVRAARLERVVMLCAVFVAVPLWVLVLLWLV